MIGEPLERADGLLKVTGAARYGGEVAAPDLVHAALFLSEIPSGRLLEVDARRADALPGVLAVLTPFDTPDHLSREIRHAGQVLGLVVATTSEVASEGARLVHPHCEPEPAPTSMASDLGSAYPPRDIFGDPPDSIRGDVERGLTGAAVRVEATYTTRMQHHHPIEPHAAVAIWEDNRLLVHTSTQAVGLSRAHLAGRLGLAPDRVRVVSPFVGGGFGSKGGAWLPMLTLVAAAARRVGRPVRLALTREQMFTLVGHRQPTIQRMALGAARDGRLTAITHATTAETGLTGDYTDPNGFASRLLYACPNVAVSHRLVRASVPMPNPMRAPGEATGTFALESALDELACALDLDPVELRLRNHADVEPHTSRPWSSKSLRECYAVGRERFGWDRRSPAPGSMRDGRHLVGWGMATSTYSAGRWPAAARARLLGDEAVVQTGSQDIGTGTYTVLAQVAAAELGLPASRVRVELGDTNLPPAPPSVGQRTAASVAPAVRAAAAALRDRVIAEATGDGRSRLAGLQPGRVEVADGALVCRDDPSRRETYASIMARRDGVPIEALGEAQAGDEARRYAMQAFGAHFVEVRVDPELGEVRVTRVTGVYAAGRILNVATARSQLTGGIVFGIGLALMEATEYDARLGRMTGTTLANYHIPLHADVPAIDVHLVEEHDPYVNELGVKGLGMLGNVGTAPAIANAVFHATGTRVRSLPITPDKLIVT